MPCNSLVFYSLAYQFHHHSHHLLHHQRTFRNPNEVHAAKPWILSEWHGYLAFWIQNVMFTYALTYLQDASVFQHVWHVCLPVYAVVIKTNHQHKRQLLAIEAANNLWLTFQVETNRTCLCCFLHRRDIYNEMLNINLSINYFFVLSLPHECSFHWSSCNRVYADIAIHTHLRKGFLLSVYYINTLFAFI